MSPAFLARSLAGRALNPYKESVEMGFSLQKVSRFGSTGKKADLQQLQAEDEYTQVSLKSQIQKRVDEQEMRMANLRKQKNLLLKKLEREGNINRSIQETHAQKIRVLGNALIFKYMKQAMKVTFVGSVFGALVVAYSLEPQMTESLGKALCQTTDGETSPCHLSG